MSFRVCMAPQLCGPAAARPRRLRCVGTAAVRLRVPSQFPVLLLLSPGDEKCNHYFFFGPRGRKNATPTTLWGPRGPRKSPLQCFRAPGTEKCNPCSVFGPAFFFWTKKFFEKKFLRAPSAAAGPCSRPPQPRPERRFGRPNFFRKKVFRKNVLVGAPHPGRPTDRPTDAPNFF